MSEHVRVKLDVVLEFEDDGSLMRLAETPLALALCYGLRETGLAPTAAKRSHRRLTQVGEDGKIITTRKRGPR